MTRILGIDFSGASDAGNKIWIAEGHKSDRPLEIASCIPARALAGGGRSPPAAIAALRQHIIVDAKTIVGCDFPFSLPAAQVRAESWAEFVAEFPQRYADPAAFYNICHREAGGIEVKRQTDAAQKTPFNSYNLRIHRQTWWGIAHLLRPLVSADAIVVRPQQRLRSGKPVLIEICPACSLKRIDCYPSYKGATPQHRQARKKIRDRLIECELLAPPSRTLRELLLDNAGGDALDAVIGAISANRADLRAKPDESETLEGRVFV